MALLAALLIELVAFVGKGLLDGTGPLFGRSALIWAVCAGFVGGLSQGMGIFMVSAARDALPWNLILLGVIVKILIGGVYGFLTFLVARVIYRSGVNPQGLPARV
ncbi:hypothetical protein [Corynebacterium pelargi]|nr:hypothetical protein [Corynebacterium pelargi]GGG80497.1 hypothetical protein GCM10007338_18810 [Corynebacterium pelargi]